MSIVEPEALACRALRDWLLWKLPASCVTINNARAAFLRAPGPGPYTIPASADLSISLDGTTYTDVALTSGSRTTTQLVTEINAAMGATVASADSDDKLLLTSTTSPGYVASTLAVTESCIFVEDDSTGANLAIGFEVGGEKCIRAPVLPPGPDGVCDGFPVGGWFNPSALGKGRVLVTLGQRSSQPTQDNPRRFEWDVLVDCAIFRDTDVQPHQSRDGIQAALAAVRNTFLTDDGMRLGRAANGDVMYARAGEVLVSPVPFAQTGADGQRIGGTFFDSANLKLRMRVFQQFP